jgi:hypothetical protein
MRNRYSAGNYQLKDEESITGMGFRQKLPTHRPEIRPRNGLPPGISDHGSFFQCEIILQTVSISESATSNTVYNESQLFWKMQA